MNSSHLTPLLQRSALATVCLLMICAMTAMAETFPLGDAVPASVPREQREAVQARAQQLADTMFVEFLLKLDELDRICDLNDSQERQLTIAAKGVVQQGLDGWLSIISSLHSAKTVDGEIRLQLGGDFLNFDGLVLRRPGHVQGLGGLKVAVNEIKVNAVGRRDVEVQISADESNKGSLLKNADECELWTETLDRTLSDQQKELYENAEAERAALSREWRHERVMVAFDRMLRLDSSQRGPLAERVGKFLEMSQIKLWLKRRQGFEDEALARMALRAIPTDDVKGFLSERQLEHWKLLLRQDLESR